MKNQGKCSQLGSLIRSRRNPVKITQKMLAAKMGISESRLIKIEDIEGVKIYRNEAVSLKKLLGITAEQIEQYSEISDEDMERRPRKISFCVYNSQIDCNSTEFCALCGWNPAVEEDRAERIANERAKNHHVQESWVY